MHWVNIIFFECSTATRNDAHATNMNIQQACAKLSKLAVFAFRGSLEIKFGMYVLCVFRPAWPYPCTLPSPSPSIATWLWSKKKVSWVACAGRLHENLWFSEENEIWCKLDFFIILKIIHIPVNQVLRKPIPLWQEAHGCRHQLRCHSSFRVPLQLKPMVWAQGRLAEFHGRHNPF